MARKRPPAPPSTQRTLGITRAASRFVPPGTADPPGEKTTGEKEELGTVVKCTADSEEDYTDPVPEAAKMPDSKFNWLGNITATELGSFSHRQEVEVILLERCQRGLQDGACPKAPEDSHKVIRGPLKDGAKESIYVLLDRVPLEGGRPGFRRKCYVVAHVVWDYLDEKSQRETYEVLATVAKFHPGSKRKSANCPNCNDGARAFPIGCFRPPGLKVCRYERSSPRDQRILPASVKDEDAIAAAKEAETTAAQIAEGVGELLLSRQSGIYTNMIRNSHRAQKCRLGSSPFSAMFVNMDVASHNHRDAGDAPGGLSAVLTLLPKGSDPTVQLHQLTGVRFEGTSENGISIALPAGSLLLEAAAHFDHQTTRIRGGASWANPSRVSLVLFQSANLDLPNHGQWKRSLESLYLLELLDAAKRDIMSQDADSLFNNLETGHAMAQTLFPPIPPVDSIEGALPEDAAEVVQVLHTHQSPKAAKSRKTRKADAEEEGKTTTEKVPPKPGNGLEGSKGKRHRTAEQEPSSSLGAPPEKDVQGEPATQGDSAEPSQEEDGHEPAGQPEDSLVPPVARRLRPRKGTEKWADEKKTTATSSSSSPHDPPKADGWETVTLALPRASRKRKCDEAAAEEVEGSTEAGAGRMHREEKRPKETPPPPPDVREAPASSGETPTSLPQPTPADAEKGQDCGVEGGSSSSLGGGDNSPNKRYDENHNETTGAVEATHQHFKKKMANPGELSPFDLASETVEKKIKNSRYPTIESAVAALDHLHAVGDDANMVKLLTVIKAAHIWDIIAQVKYYLQDLGHEVRSWKDITTVNQRGKNHVSRQRQVAKIVRSLPRLLETRTSFNDIEKHLPNLKLIESKKEHEELRKFWAGNQPDYAVEENEFIIVDLANPKTFEFLLATKEKETPKPKSKYKKPEPKMKSDLAQALKARGAEEKVVKVYRRSFAFAGGEALPFSV